uniref:NADH dehydrogenase subunit 4L n=1 Tax=Sinosolenaia oleivora TaxID=3237505 RepID=A0A3G1GHS0_9BIVA|nr:NADH dehydrogenase subunit 4L [Solenaia oleivora]
MSVSCCGGVAMYLVMVVLSVCCILSQRHSLLGILLGFEVFSLVLFCSFVGVFGVMQSPVGLSLVFLCLEVCVMSVCLALMIKLVKVSGSDYVGVCSFSDSY